LFSPTNKVGTANSFYGMVVSKKAFLTICVLGAILIFVVPSSYSYYYTLIETDVLFPGHKWDDPDDVPGSFLDKQYPGGMISIPFLLPLFLEDRFCGCFSGFSFLTLLNYPISSVLRC
jgi:hypothetical protein